MYKIEITAETLSELAGKAMSLAAKLNTVAGEVAEAAAVDPTPAPKSAPVVEASESQPTTEQPSTTPAASAEPIDFEKVVAPLVLRLVAEKGRETVEALLADFDVTRASQIEDSELPAFVQRVEELLAL